MKEPLVRSSATADKPVATLTIAAEPSTANGTLLTLRNGHRRYNNFLIIIAADPHFTTLKNCPHAPASTVHSTAALHQQLC